MPGTKQCQFLAAQEYILAFGSANESAIGTLVTEDKFTTPMVNSGMMPGDQIALNDQVTILATTQDK